MFPRYFGWEVPCETGPKYFIGDTLTRIEHSLRKQVREALLFRDESLSKEEVREQTSKICSDFFYRLPEIQRLLLKDVQAATRQRNPKRRSSSPIPVSTRPSSIASPMNSI